MKLVPRVLLVLAHRPTRQPLGKRLSLPCPPAHPFAPTGKVEEPEVLTTDFTLEKAVEPQISQINTDYQGIAEFKALTQRVSFD